tara:strand:+ start:161 stop:310 length:150 start_codon:yes stop_codon:yes gene_type:complete
MKKNKETIRSCAECKEEFLEDSMMLLAEWELGLSSIENYIVCGECYENM